MSENSKVQQLLKEALAWLKRIEEKVDRILEPATVIMLPDRFRSTMIVVQQLGEATTTQVAERTGRLRATESAFLNELVRMGRLKRRKEGRTVYFSSK